MKDLKTKTKKPEKEENYDLIIIGAGGTGLAGAMYGARLGLKTLVLGATCGFELPVGGVITTTNVVENYPGFIRLTGAELAEKIEKHARSYDLVTIKEEKVIEIKKQNAGPQTSLSKDQTKSKNFFKVKTEKTEYITKTIIFATGTKWKKLPDNVKGAKEFENKGVNYCALCDGPLYKNKIVAIVGGSDSAAKDALVLAEHAKKVYMIYRGEKIHPEPINFERVKANKKIEIINSTNIKEIRGDSLVREVVLDKPYKKSKILKLDAVFVAIGHIILSELAKTLGVKTNEKEEIITDKTASTNIQGVYAAGDVANTPFKQLITGVAEGCVAAYSAYEYITKNKVEV